MVEPVTTTVAGYFALHFAVSYLSRAASDLTKEAIKMVKNAKKSSKSKNSKVSEAEKKYWKAQEKYQREWLKIQQQGLDIQEAQLQAYTLVEQARAEREERALELQQAHLDWLREQQVAELDLAMKKIQADYDKQDKEHWPSILSRQEMVDILATGQKQHRLLVIVSEPDISRGCPSTFTDNLPMELRGELKQWLEQVYPLDNSLCPVEFYGKFFKTAVFDTQVKQLETMLATIPTVVIYSDLTDEKLFLHLRVWGPMPLSRVVSWDWAAMQEELQADGKTEKQSLKQIRQAIVGIHQFLVTFLTDMYYLTINPFHEPRLLQLAHEVENQELQECFATLRCLQDQRRADYEEELRLLAEREEAYELGKKYDQQGDDEQAVFWYRKAAEQGLAGAQYNLGVMCENGRGMAQDNKEKEAVFWYRKAAEQGHVTAQCNLGWMYDKGCGVTQDNKEAVFWYRKAAEQGLDWAQNNLGWMYQKGRSVTQDDKEAVFWYRKAAEQGFAMAQNNLGWMYQKGRGVIQDNKEAVFWYHKASEQGLAVAQNNLGWMYGNGHGVTQDNKEAVFWYRKAAEQGDALAQFNLGLMYGNGHGVTQDDKEAVFWYRKAAERGNEDAKKALQRLDK